MQIFFINLLCNSLKLLHFVNLHSIYVFLFYCKLSKWIYIVKVNLHFAKPIYFVNLNYTIIKILNFCYKPKDNFKNLFPGCPIAIRTSTEVRQKRADKWQQYQYRKRKRAQAGQAKAQKQAPSAAEKCRSEYRAEQRSHGQQRHRRYHRVQAQGQEELRPIWSVEQCFLWKRLSTRFQSGFS